MLATLALLFMVLFTIELVRLNLESEDRSAHCGCLNGNSSIWERLRLLRHSSEWVLQDPNKRSVSFAAHSLGRVAGFFVMRPYVRFPLDMYFFMEADQNMHAHECILGYDQLAPVAGPRGRTRRVCPSTLTKNAAAH